MSDTTHFTIEPRSVTHWRRTSNRLLDANISMKVAFNGTISIRICAMTVLYRRKWMHDAARSTHTRQKSSPGVKNASQAPSTRANVLSNRLDNRLDNGLCVAYTRHSRFFNRFAALANRLLLCSHDATGLTSDRTNSRWTLIFKYATPIK